jgi:hypothetical protein
LNLNHNKDLTYAKSAEIADARTISALIAIGSPPLELDEDGRVAVQGGMSQTMMRAYGVAYLGQTNGNLWASLDYPLETSASERPEPHQQPEMSFTSGKLLERCSRKSSNLAIFLLIVVIAVALALWFSGFNVFSSGG